MLQAAMIPSMEVPEESHRGGVIACSEEDAASTAEQVKKAKMTAFVKKIQRN